MIRRGSRIAIFSGALALVAAASPVWADMKIGVVNVQQLLQDSPDYKAAMESMQSEFGARSKQLQSEAAALKARQDNLQKDEATMTQDARDAAEKALRDGTREYQMRANQFQDDVNARQNQEQSKLQRSMIDEIGRYAKSQQFDLVVSIGVLYANPSLDITSQVLASMQSGRAGAAAPHTTGATLPKSGASSK